MHAEFWRTALEEGLSHISPRNGFKLFACGTFLGVVPCALFAFPCARDFSRNGDRHACSIFLGISDLPMRAGIFSAWCMHALRGTEWRETLSVPVSESVQKNGIQPTKNTKPHHCHIPRTVQNTSYTRNHPRTHHRHPGTQ